MELSGSNIKKVIFSLNKAFLVFKETELFYISGNRTPKKIPYILGNFLYFRK